MVKKKIDIKDEVKVEEPKDKVEETVIVSEIDATIRNRMKSQPIRLEDIELKGDERKEGEHFLSLPKELTKYEDRFRFYWAGKNKRKIDHALDVRGWVIVNRTLFPELPKHLVSVSGAVERGDAILVCMARKRAEALNKKPQDKSSELLRANLAKAKTHPDFYEPKDSGKDEEARLVEGRDF